MPKIKEISVLSKRTISLNNNKEFFSFESTYTVDVSDVDDKDVDAYCADLYSRINAVIDKQADEAVEAVTPPLDKDS